MEKTYVRFKVGVENPDGTRLYLGVQLLYARYPWRDLPVGGLAIRFDQPGYDSVNDFESLRVVWDDQR